MNIIRKKNSSQNTVINGSKKKISKKYSNTEPSRVIFDKYGRSTTWQTYKKNV